MGQNRAGQALLLVAVVVLLSGCQGFAALDQPPVAKFTVVNQSGESVLRVGEKVVLDASDSKDPQGYALTYEWELKTAQQKLVRLSSVTGKTVWFYPDDELNSYFVSLRVTARSQSDVTELRSLTIDKANPEKLLLTTKTDTPYDSYGTVEPWGVRALTAGDVFLLSATPKKGYRFLKWIVSGTGGVQIVDLTKPSTSASLSSGPVTIQAVFEAAAVTPQFHAWKKVYPNGLAKADGETGLVTTVGNGYFSGQMVSLARGPDDSLYAAGSPFSSPVGVQLFVIDPTTGLAGSGLDFQSGKTLVTVSSLAFSAAGTLYALEKASAPRLFRADPKTANLSLASDLLLNGQPVALKSVTSSEDPDLLWGTDGTTLYHVDSYGKVTRIGPFNVIPSLTSLTSAHDGRLFAIDEGSAVTSLYSIEPSDGSATLVVPMTVGLLSLLVQ